MEPTEIREEVKEEFERQEKREVWINYLALTTVILAVCATLASFKLEHYSVESVLKQTMASDQWAFYQAKANRESLYELQGEKLALDLKAIEKGSSSELVEEYKKDIESCNVRAKRYEKEKTDIMKEAEHLQKERNEAMERREVYGVAIIFLQIAILLCSIAALMKRKWIWAIASVIGTAGIVYVAKGFLHLV